jgi:hypothetical protein
MYAAYLEIFFHIISNFNVYILRVEDFVLFIK